MQDWVFRLGLCLISSKYLVHVSKWVRLIADHCAQGLFLKKKNKPWKKWTVYIFFLGSSGRLALHTLSRQFINCIRQFLLLITMGQNHFYELKSIFFPAPKNHRWKLGQLNAICWNSLNLFRDYSIDQIF